MPPWPSTERISNAGSRASTSSPVGTGGGSPAGAAESSASAAPSMHLGHAPSGASAGTGLWQRGQVAGSLMTSVGYGSAAGGYSRAQARSLQAILHLIRNSLPT